MTKWEQSNQCVECGSIHLVYNTGLYTCSSCGAQFTSEELMVSAPFNDSDEFDTTEGN